ncbi:uncharacterized protein PV09_00860 [Verruconis gallopava]|uniref:Elongation factor 2 n=1 Tax=Verruconis gallopava TaxID=253628 RepID=A0A0D1Y1K5_9PEZI|nr:uncharacterized protein PV09_00860 [Verruconis gallopava]KIW08946.1 hypothetical protein PV09_00860 [Verruconis gallopava]
MADNNLVSQPLTEVRDLNWVLLVELLVSGIVAVFFFGYFDRLFATLVSYAIRAYTWRNFHAYIDIQALQISLLGGRIFFKELRYHAHNETIVVHSGYITWKYWYRKVRDAEVFSESLPNKSSTTSSSSRSRTPSPNRTESGGVKKHKTALPCRIQIKVEGVQAFLYNRSPVYDAIVKTFAEASNADDKGPAFDAMGLGKSTSSETSTSATGVFERLGHRFNQWHSPEKAKETGSQDKDGEQCIASRSEGGQKPPKLPTFLQLFPIRVRCKIAAAVLGNDNTKAIITARIDNADGTFDAGHAGPLDVYKLLFNFEFENTVIKMRPNHDFKEPQLTMAAGLKNEAMFEDSSKSEERPRQSKVAYRRAAILGRFFGAGSSSQSVRATSVGRDTRNGHHLQAPYAFPGQERWQGLTRYLDDDIVNEHDEWDPIEYALYSTIAEVPKIGMLFYWDIPGLVPTDQEMLDTRDENLGDINGSTPPAYGMDLHVFGGTIHYGPWADRQRIQFQNIFFPPTFANAIPARNLLPGEARVSTVFKLRLIVEENTTLRMPVREPSKDWKWKGKAASFINKTDTEAQGPKGKWKGKRKSFWRTKDKGTAGPNMRPFAWLDLTVKANTTVNYTADMLARPSGYKAKVHVEVSGLEIQTSVNHGLLWRSGCTRIDADLSVPLGWNALREWTFNITNDDLELFILRDHLFLMIDIISDWSSGPLAEYYTFIPYKYLLNICFRNFRLYLNTNTSNIIDEPADFDKNQFVVLCGATLQADVIIPLDKFRPERNEIFFDVLAKDLGLQLCLSPGNTVAAFLGQKKVALLDRVTLKGTHAAWSETSTNLTDRLTFDIHGEGLDLYLFGYVVDRLVTLKENYFGDDLHFKTLEEFQEMSRGKDPAAESDAKAQQSNRSNDLDVILMISAEKIRGYIPSNLYGADESVIIDCPFASADLRLNNYYMDLQVDFSPLSVSHIGIEGGSTNPVKTTSETEVFVASTSLVGHRTFGLPPKEPDYLCLWDVNVGAITGECTDKFVNLLTRAGACFASTLDDNENATALVEPIVVHDIQFLKLRTQDIKVWLHVGSDALLISTGHVVVDMNDWAGLFSKRVKILIPDLVVALVEAKSGSRHRLGADENKPIQTHAHMRTTICFSVLVRKLQFSEEMRKQQEHLLESDSRTHRTPFLIRTPQSTSVLSLMRNHYEQPASIYPPVPEPLTHETRSASNVSSPAASFSRLSSSSSFSSTSKPDRPKSRLSRQISQASLAQSLRKTGVRSQRDDHSLGAENTASEGGNNYGKATMVNDKYGAKRGLSTSSVAFSSSLAAPRFALQGIVPDASDLPSPDDVPQMRHDSSLPAFNDVVNREIDEEITHTSIIINAEPGIQFYFKPEAISAVAALLDLVLPKSPDELLDALQMQVVSQLLNLEKRKKGAGESLELAARVPFVSVRFLNTFHGANVGPAEGIDQYEFEVKSLALTLKNLTQPASRRDIVKDSVLVHCAINSVTFHIKEAAKGRQSQERCFYARLEDLLLWLSTAEKNSVHISFRSFDVEASSKQIELLAGVVQRASLLISDSTEKLTALWQNYKDRQRYLAYSLTMSGNSVSDPPFLNRTGIALRVAPHHIRNHDSWKIISRLRYIWQNMSAVEKQSLATECKEGCALYPANAEAVVTKNWDEWRTWDLAHVKRSHIMHILYGSVTEDSSIPSKESSATELQIRGRAIRVTVDPGSDETQFAIHALAINLDLSPPLSPSGLMLIQTPVDVPIEDVLMHASAKSITLGVNWEIINLVELALKFAQQDLEHIMLRQAKSDALMGNTIQKKIWRSFQVVISVGNIGLSVDTPNLNALVASKDFSLSIVGTDKSSSSNGSYVNALFHAAQSYIDLRSHQHHLAHLGAEAPNLLISHDTKGITSHEPDDLRFAGTTSNVVVETKEELLGIIETIDMVVRHEVALGIQKFSRFMPGSSPTTSTTKMNTSSGTLPKITMALIMDSYRFDVALFPTLKFSMYGKLGRISVSPQFRDVKSLDINVDLGERSHDLISRDALGTHVISVLNMPPLNGKIKLRRTPERLDIVVSMIIETIVFEAHAVHGLLSILSEDEVTSTFKALVADAQTLKQDIDAVLSQSKPPQTSIARSPALTDTVTYNAVVTLAGIQIKADAPGKLMDSGTAKLLIAFNGLHLTVFNTAPDRGEFLVLPEIHARMKEFVVDLLITDSRGTRRSGNLSLAAAVHCTLRKSRKGQIKRNYRAQVNSVHVNIYAETASAVVDVLNHLQDRLKDVDLSKEKKYLRRLRQPNRRPSSHLKESMYSDLSMTSTGLLDSYISVSLNDIQVVWIVGGSVTAFPKYKPEDLVLSIRLIDLSTKSENSSSLKIQDFQIQMVPSGGDRIRRSLNSALMPQVIFNVAYASTDEERKLAFQAAGESVDIVLDSKFMLPANMLQRSIELAIDKFRDVSMSWQMTPTASGAQRKKLLGDKRLSSLLVDADFAGAVLRLKGRGRAQNAAFASSMPEAEYEKNRGRYGQFIGDDNSTGTKIETPGLAIRVQYKDNGLESSLNGEIKVSGSSNTLVPTVVPLILEISDSIKTIVAMNESAPQRPTTPSASTTLIDENLLTADPNELLGGTSINLGVRICRQEFSLSCQPIARVAASAHIDDIYITANNVKSTEHDHFIAVSARFDNLQASIQHIYSRESTFNFAIQSIALSVMNSKHLSGKAGLCAVVKVFPMRTQINARQLQDFLLFREIWLPPEIRSSSAPPASPPTVDSQDYFVARYQQVTNTAAFPWTATLQIAEMKVEIDMGQSIGKASLFIDNLWASSRKDSNWEQNLIIGIGQVGMECTGRTSGFVDLSNLKVRTMIAWPKQVPGHRRTPMIQAAVGFERLRVKAAFDYQAFGIADISSFDFLMYNVRPDDPREKDRLVAMLEGDKIHVFCTATTAAQSVALFQAFEKLKQDTESAYANSLKDIERFLRRHSTTVQTQVGTKVPPQARVKKEKGDAADTPINLYTDVVVTIRSIQVGAFPSAFYDSQIFLIEASDVQARFAAMVDRGKVRTGLGMTLGQLQVALTAVQQPTGPRTLQEITVDDVVTTAVQSRGGTILRVPKVIATMETWQSPGQMTIEYIFKSRFEGKVDVGWNVGRISFIRGMYNNHARNLASRLGKPLPESAVKIRTEQIPSEEDKANAEAGREPEKITAVVNVPISKYNYIPLEPPIIETPQLRDMGEATPPLEWIGLHRDRLPNVTHQIVIVGLMGIAREVEDAYGRILGNS